MIEWQVKGISFGNCNCDHACPCQFEGLPTYGNCEAMGVTEVTSGTFGNTDLAGARFAVVYKWPGPVFEGGGELQLVIDADTTEEQRDAIKQIALGGETVEASTVWWVYATMCDTHHETLVRPIDLAVDMDTRTASCRIEGVLESSAEPIKGRVDGSPHRVQIRVPHGIEFDTAEIVNARTQASAAVSLELQDSYGQLCELHLTNRGPAHNLKTA